MLQDGSADFSGGQNAALVPHKIPENAYYAGVNVSTKDGAISPPYGLEEKSLDIYGFFEFPNGDTRSYESIFRYGKYQAIIPYSVGTESFLIIIISGVIFFYNQGTGEVTVVEISDGSKLNELHPRINWSAAGRFIVIFDFPAYPVIIEGLTAKRADPNKLEVPRSVLGTYNQNRLFIANAGNEFTAGDPAAVGFPDGPVTFEEVLLAPYFGQIFQLSTNYNNDPITAMTFLQVVDRSTGIGPLLVSTINAIYSYQTNLPRNQWEASQFGSVFLYGTGIVGPRAFCNVNADLFFIGADGFVYSLSMSREDLGKWSRSAISKEMQNYIGDPPLELLRFSTMAYYKNKVLFTINPFRTLAQTTDYKQTFDYAFGGFGVLELDSIATLGKDSFPAWAGIRVSCRPMDIVQNDNRCFIISKESGINTLWELRSDLSYDIVKGKPRQIRSKIYTREYSFQTPFQPKVLNQIILGISKIKGNFRLRISYKPSHGSTFILWREFTHEAPYRYCEGDLTCFNFSPHDLREIMLGSPEDPGCNPVTLETYDTFNRVQLLFEIEGIYWELEEFLIMASELPMNVTETDCGGYPAITICADCDTDWRIPECQPKM